MLFQMIALLLQALWACRCDLNYCILFCVAFFDDNILVISTQYACAIWAEDDFDFFHVSRSDFRYFRLATPELSDAGGPARPHCQLTWPARIHSNDFVGARMSMSKLTHSALSGE